MAPSGLERISEVPLLGVVKVYVMLAEAGTGECFPFLALKTVGITAKPYSALGTDKYVDFYISWYANKADMLIETGHASQLKTV